MRPAAPKPAFKHSVEPDGTLTLRITLKGLKLKPNDSYDRYFLADVERHLPMTIDCEGVSCKPIMILKIFCRSGNGAPVIRKRKELERLREHNPLIY